MKRASLLISLLVTAAVQAAPYEELCATLQKTPWEAKGLQQLQTLMRNEREPVAIRSRSMALCTLALLRQGNTNQFARALQLLEATYPEGKGLVTTSVSEHLVACTDCQGKGKRDVSCPGCKGSSCPRCKGTHVVQTVCSVCRGAGQQFKLGPSVLENYNRLLAEIMAFGQESQRFETETALALAETVNEKKIARLEAVLANFPQRTDLERVKKSLEEAQKIRDAARSRRQEEERRDKEEAEVERLRGLRQTPAAACQDAIQQIDAFMLKHPKCFARSELEELKTELTAKRNLRNRLISSATWLGGICALLLVTAFLKVVLGARRVEALRPLPGMDRIDKSKFTDPLADEREKTEARRRKGER